MTERNNTLEEREMLRSRKIAAMQRFIDEGLKSGIGTASRDELFARARESADLAGKPEG